MPIALNNTTLFNTSATVSATVGSGNQRLIVVGISSQGGGVATNVKWNGTNLTKASGATTTYGLSIWYLLSPASGTFNVTFTAPSGSANYDGFIMDFTNAEQSVAVIDGVSGFAPSPGSSDTLNVVTTKNNTFIVDLLYINNGATMTVGGTQTQIQNVTGIGASSYKQLAVAGTYGMAWTFGSSQFAEHTAVGFAGSLSNSGALINFF